MISIKKEKHSLIIKALFGLLFLLIVLFSIKNLYIIIVNKSKVENLTVQIELQKKSNEHLISKTKDLNTKIEETKKAYPTTQELEAKLKEIFKRMSILDYNLVLLGTEKLCIDRHILVSRLDAKTQKDKKAALGILNYLGETKQSTKDENVYFVDYIAQKKALK